MVGESREERCFHRVHPILREIKLQRKKCNFVDRKVISFLLSVL